MDTNTYDIKNLWQLYIKNEATPEQVQQLYDLVKEGQRDEENQAMIEEYLARIPISSPVDSVSKDFIINNLVQAHPELAGVLRHSDNSKELTIRVHRLPFLRRGFFKYAAAILIICGVTGAYLWTTNKKSNSPDGRMQQTVDIAPGTEGAILTLADGSQIVLDSLGNGVIATQNGAQVLLQNGQLAYDPTSETAGETMYNTLTTPKGRQFQVVLPDGTKVWLNAAGSIRYPTVFIGKARSVAITGEAYFEVAKNDKMPFRVSINNSAEVEVLGTHFNVKAYENEKSINTTLLEGSVKMAAFQAVVTGEASENASLRSGRPVILTPGQQAQIVNISSQSKDAITAKRIIKVVNNANIEKAMAWKNGLIYFDGASFDEIMRQLERWYDIDVVYENNKVPKTLLAGKMTRDVPLDGLLKNLEELGMHYKFTDRTLIVLP